MDFSALHDHPSLATIRNAVQNSPAEVFVVGGTVRDALLGRPLKDLDLVIRGVAINDLERMLGNIGTVDVVGKRFAVLKLTLPDRTIVDVALPRTDASFGTGRYQDVAVHADHMLPITEDLKRRDFTINALAWNAATGELIDPHGGQRDLTDRVIRCVGDPLQRFHEDATRILRAIRLATELECAIEPATAAALTEQLSLLNDEQVTPREVIAKELVRAFSANPVRAYDLLDEHRIIRALLPELDAMHGCAQPPEYHAEGDVWTHTRLALAALQSDEFRATFKTQPAPMLAIATLLHDIGKPPTQRTPERDGTDRIRFNGHASVGAGIARDICQRLRFDSTGSVDCGELVWLVEHHLDILNLDAMKPTTLEQTYLVPPQRGLLLQQLTWADARASLDPDEATAGKLFHEVRRFQRLQARLQEIKARGYRGCNVVPLLSGNDIIQLLDIDAGPAVGKLIQDLRDAQLNGTVATAEQARTFIKQRYVERTER